MPLPILYSLRQCPYAMRARMGIFLSRQPVMLRDIIMTNIPDDMVIASAKAEVPVLVLPDSSVIDQSLDVMIWALKNSDPDDLLLSNQSNAFEDMLDFIYRSDNEFVDNLKKYKAASRYHDETEIHCREQCEVFISELELRLTKHDYLMGNSASLADYAILPFIRQFSRVDRKWYLQAPYLKLQLWLDKHYQNPMFSKVMKKYPQWLESKEDVLFGCDFK
ncbi:MAG: glutathione S-transferase [Woeseiaceae bacterium]